VGGFVWDIASDAWWWTPGFYRIHGLRPGEQEATLDLLLQQVCDEDRTRVEDWLTHVAKVEGRFAFEYRVGPDGTRHAVASEGVSETGYAKSMLVTGHVASPEESPQQTEIEQLRSEVHQAWAAHEARGDIEKAKGAIMLACHCDEAVAFQVLSRTSQQTNLKVREIAAQILSVVADQDHGGVQPRLRRTILRELLWAKGEGAPDGR
jgi:hypothetical protein